jgi:hypothetical protein
MLLIIIEIIILFIFLIFALKSLSLDPLMALFIFATYIVIEASLAVSILTLIVRSHGNDFIII